MMLGGGGDGGGAMVLSSGHQEGGGDNSGRVHEISNNTLVGVIGEEEINSNARNGNNMEDGDRNSTGSRWPRQETLALLKIRSDMDVAFRDSNLKGPLWDDVSRKMAELGYQRSAKKCKEKFENVYKYHKRTKDGRSSKSDGKTYRFFDQLEALDQLQPFQIQSPAPQPPQSKGGLSFQMPPQPQPQPPQPQPVLQTPTTISFGQQQQPRSNVLKNPITTAVTTTNPSATISHNFQSGANFMMSTSSSTSSDDFQQTRRSGKKRKWKDFFEKLMRDVVEKQEELQTKFLRTIEMRERERSMREEAWRMQEMARLNREHEILVQERSAAAAKDAALISFLQKIAGQQQPQTQPQLPPQPKQQPAAPPPPIHTNQLISTTTPPPPPQPQPVQPQRKPVTVMKPIHNNAAGDLNKMMVCSTTSPSPSRWPKAEVEALIKLRTSFEIKYQENVPKGPFWEEISAGMRNLGYNRNAKRCKEKWENINKYFKKVKESNKQRPEDSKTCPYYHLLEAIYKEKKGGGNGGGDYNYPPPPSTNSLMAPLMVQPEQQWPLAPQTLSSSHAQNPNNEDEEQDDMLDEDDLDQDMEDEEEEDEEAENNSASGTYEVVAAATASISNKPQHGSSGATTGSMETAVA